MEDFDRVASYLPGLLLLEKAFKGDYDVDFEDVLDDLDRHLSQSYSIFTQEASCLVEGEPPFKLSEQIAEAFVAVGATLDEVRTALGNEEEDQAEFALGQFRQRAEELCRFFDSYQQILSEQPKLSEIPYTHELVRVVRHFLDGTISSEAVEQRVAMFMAYHEALEAQLASFHASKAEGRVFEERSADLEEGLALQFQALQDLEEAVGASDRALIEASLAVILDVSELFVDVYRSLQKADAGLAAITCIRCSVDNSGDARVCIGCGAKLPRGADLLEPSSTVAWNEDGSLVGSVESAEVQQLEAMVALFLQDGQGAKVLSHLDHFARRIARCRRQFEKLGQAPQDIPAKHAHLLVSAKQIFSEALDNLSFGEQSLREGVQQVDHLKLEEGMRALRLGETLLLEFGKIFEQAQTMAEVGV